MRSRSIVGIVLVNFNGRRFLNDCVRALNASHGCHVDIVVVDNQSTDDSLALLRAEFPTLTVLPQDKTSVLPRRTMSGSVTSSIERTSSCCF